MSSSIKYGLTSGSFNQERVTLTDLGRKIVAPLNPEDRRKALLQAVFNPPTFKAVYAYFRGKKVPEKPFFQNTIAREFEIPREHTAVCAKILTANLRYVGLLREASTGLWVSSDGALPLPVSPAPRTGGEATPNGKEHLEEAGVLSEPNPPADGPKGKGSIFIGHGRNRVPLEQLKDLLNQFKIPYKLAVEEANGFRPISQKVAEVMRECDAAILIFTAETELRDAQGNSVWKPSENVICELGASSVLYGDKIVIFKETAVNFPTNFQGIGHITFEKDQLNGKVNELFKELINFGLIKITVGA